MSKSRKAQVTAFIIIGIVIVAALILYFLLAKKPEAIETGTPSESVAAQVKPVYSFVSDCLEQETLKGIELLRLQGGYIYLPSDVELVEVETDAGKQKVPLWLSDDSMAVPSLEFMENQLSSYLESETPKCADLSGFKDRNFEISSLKPEATVILRDSAIITLKWPISVDYKNENYRFEDFSKRLNINFSQVYDVASGLLIYELGYNYLESHAKSLLSLYSYAGGSKESTDIPPMSFTDTSTDCNFVSWNKQEVDSTLKNIFQQNYQYLKIANTNFQQVKAKDKLSQGVYDSFIHDYFPEMKNIHVDFSYDSGYDTYVYVWPPSLMPERLSQNKIPFLPSFCSFSYEFEYTISAPILVKIRDTKSPNIRDGKIAEQGFTFYFPMRMYLCADESRGCTNTEPDYSANLEAIENLTGVKFYNCDSIDKTTEISVKDDRGFALDGVDITHRCGGYANECWLGRTSNGRAVISLPKCSSSSLELVKQGYGTIKDSVKSEYSLDKVRNITVDVKLVRADKFAAAYSITNGFTKDACGKSPGTWLSSSVYNPSLQDRIILSLGGLGGNMVNYPSSKNLEIAAGSYELQSTVISSVTIKPSVYESQTVSFNTQDKTKPYVGDWMMGSASYPIVLSRSELAGKSKITFYILVEHFSNEELSVKSFDSSVIQDNLLKGTVQVDDDCDGKTSDKEVSISSSQYANILKPKLS
ncbi:MAG: hypothetical protein KKB21_02325 [Nanoarchaeota archaeon]|nr:hypothetical protein [Nanoarchaeota archaeon]